jgi:hypothetical protein
MGGRAGWGEGGPPAAADLPIRSMGGHASQAGGRPGARVAKMEDNGHEVRAEARKTSAVESGVEDDRGG